MKLFFWCFTLVFVLVLSSCSVNKDLIYLQEKGTITSDSLQIRELSKPYRVQVSDVLSINVKALDKELVAIFNPVEGAGTYLSDFTVDLHGNIEFPVLGVMNVLGYTTEEVEDKIEAELLKKYFKETAELFVTVKLAGLRYTTIGEIQSGVHTLMQDRVNIIQALANAGDISLKGNRKDVLIIRQYPDGQKIHHIDLTDVAAMQSPYYYIQPNDIILVKPVKGKAWDTTKIAIQEVVTLASVFTSLFTVYFISKNL